MYRGPIEGGPRVGLRLTGQAHELRHIGSCIRVDHLKQKLPYSVGGAIWQVFCGVFKAFGLQSGQAHGKVMTFPGGEQKPLAPVQRPRSLLDKILVDQLFQNPAEALLGNAQDIEQVGHLGRGGRRDTNLIFSFFEKVGFICYFPVVHTLCNFSI